MTKEKRDAEWLAIDAELDNLDRVGDFETVPVITWDWPAKELNAVLRALWERIELGTNMLPVRTVWRVPEWRV